MTENIERSISAKLPTKLNLNVVYLSTIIQVVIMVGVSVLGILYQGKLYPNEDLSIGFVSNDILNLLVGIPIIIISMLLTKRRKLVGLLCYPRALFYITYVYITYLSKRNKMDRCSPFPPYLPGVEYFRLKLYGV